MSISVKDFGTTTGGEAIKAYVLTNSKGMEATVISYGAILTSLIVPDKNGKKEDVVLGYDTLEPYFENGSFFGVTVGRNANRIKDAKITIDGVVYQLDVNDGPNNLHSHFDNGLHKRVYDVQVEEGTNAVVFYVEEEDGTNGFPGKLELSVTYRLTEDNELLIAYHGVSDKKTVINCTNHTYFNLAGHASGNVHEQYIQIHADKYTPVVPGAIPTGECADVAGTPFDLRKAVKIGAHVDDDFKQLKLVQGYDHNFCINNANHTMRECAVAYDEGTGRRMKVLTDLPGVQFYAGNCIGDTIGKSGVKYTKRSGFCLETQYYPNSMNQEGFESPIIDAGVEYNTSTVYKFDIKQDGELDDELLDSVVGGRCLYVERAEEEEVIY